MSNTRLPNGFFPGSRDLGLPRCAAPVRNWPHWTDRKDSAEFSFDRDFRSRQPARGNVPQSVRKFLQMLHRVAEAGIADLLTDNSLHRKTSHSDGGADIRGGFVEQREFVQEPGRV